MVVSGWPPVKGPSEDVEGLEGLGGDLQAGGWRPRLDLDPKPACNNLQIPLPIFTNLARFA